MGMHERGEHGATTDSGDRSDKLKHMVLTVLQAR